MAGWMDLPLKVLDSLVKEFTRVKTIFHLFQCLPLCPVQSLLRHTNQCVNKDLCLGTSLVVQWFRLCTTNARGVSLIPGWGTEVPHAPQHSQKKKKKKNLLKKNKTCVYLLLL